MSAQKPPAAGVVFERDGPRFSCARCGDALDGLGGECGAVRCPECGLEQRLNSDNFTEFSRLEILAVTIVTSFVGSVVALSVFEPGSRATGRFVLLYPVCAVVPSLVVALLFARKINRPAGLTVGGRVRRAIWWWLLGSLIAFVVEAALLGPATGG